MAKSRDQYFDDMCSDAFLYWTEEDKQRIKELGLSFTEDETGWILRNENVETG